MFYSFLPTKIYRLGRTSLQDALVLRDTYWHEWNRVLFMSGTSDLLVGWGGKAMVQG